MTSPQMTKETQSALNILGAINKLTIKAFTQSNSKALTFLILNDSIQVVRYDRAVLFKKGDKSPKILGISGQSSVSSSTSIAERWKRMVADIQKSEMPQVLSNASFLKEVLLWEEYASSSTHPVVLWIPIKVHEEVQLGLWVERWEEVPWAQQEADILVHLSQTYGVAWEKLHRNFSFSFASLRVKILGLIILLAVLIACFIPVPLRVTAPCEIVPSDPFLVTAPLEDIIDRIIVKPGEHVVKGQLLFEYDKRVALQSLKIAEEQLQVAQRDLNRATTLAFRDERALVEIGVLEAKLKKEQANLELARYRASELVVKSPEAGVVILENPDEWRGKPVKVGEKVMSIANSSDTKIRLWIPERDNIILNLEKPIKVFLNVSPTITREARLKFISNASAINEKSLVSFVAEANWIEPQEDVRFGLKGTAILYGEEVPLIYWILRKPWATFREYTGI